MILALTTSFLSKFAWIFRRNKVRSARLMISCASEREGVISRIVAHQWLLDFEHIHGHGGTYRARVDATIRDLTPWTNWRSWTGGIETAPHPQLSGDVVCPAGVDPAEEPAYVDLGYLIPPISQAKTPGRGFCFTAAIERLRRRRVHLCVII